MPSHVPHDVVAHTLPILVEHVVIIGTLTKGDTMNTRLDMFLSLTPKQRGVVGLIFFAFFIVPGYAMYNVGNSVRANRVLGQIESVLITDVDNTIETMRLF